MFKERDRSPRYSVGGADSVVSGTPFRHYEQVVDPEGGGSIRELLRKHDFRQLLAGFAISSAGDWLYGVALLVYVYDRTGSAAWVGATTIVRLIPYILFGALGGVIADRYEKRTVMVVTDLARALLMFGLAAAAFFEGPALLTLVFAFLATTAGTPEGPALGSLLPKVCEEDELARANSIMGTVEQLALVIGPAIGGLLLLLGSPATAFAVNGVTFLAAAFFAARVATRTRSVDAADEVTGGITARIAEGIGGIRGSGTASLLVALLIAAAALYGFELVFVVLLAEERLGMGSQGVGWLTAATGLGGLAGAVVVGRVATSRRGDVVLLVSVALLGLPLAALGVTSAVPLALLFMGIVGTGGIMFDVIATTILQRVVPEGLLARVLGILDSLGVAAMLLGSILAPTMVALFGLGITLLIVGLTLPAICLVAIPRLRALRRAANETMDKLAPIVELLERSGAFEGASRQALEGAAAASTFQDVRAGEIVIHEADEADDFFVIADGTFEVTARGESQGPERTVNVLGSGDYFGEVGLLAGHRRTATVKAITPARVLRLPGSDFLESVQQAPAPPVLLMTSYANRLSKTHPSLEPSIAGGTGA